MRDENGFKQHTMSEAHVRAMLAVGEDPRKYINEYSNQFKSDFLRLLKTAHGEKKVHANNFYQEYISDKEHVHMNSTKWPSLTEFVKYLSREGICRVEEGERGMEIAWVDDSPDALRRREAVAKKERMEKGEEERQARLLEQQIKRAKEAKADKEQNGDDEDEKAKSILEKTDGQSIGFSLGGKLKETSKPLSTTIVENAQEEDVEPPEGLIVSNTAAKQNKEPSPAAPVKGMSFSMSTNGKSKPVNVFSSKSNPLKQKTSYVAEQPKKMGKLEEIMLKDKEEQGRKRQRHGYDDSTKRPRLG